MTMLLVLALVLSGEWHLEWLDGAPPIRGSELYVRFEDDRIAGKGGVNEFTGRVSFPAPAVLAIEAVEVEGPPAPSRLVNAQQALFLRLLQEADAYAVVDGRLWLYRGGQAVLGFRQK